MSLLGRRLSATTYPFLVAGEADTVDSRLDEVPEPSTRFRTVLTRDSILPNPFFSPFGSEACG